MRPLAGSRPRLRSYRIGKRALIAIASGFALVAAVVIAIAMTSGDAEQASAPAGTASPEGRLDHERTPESRETVAEAERRQRRKERAGRRDDAAEFLAGREGRSAFAEIGPDGVLRGVDEHEPFQSASLIKAMILAAFLQDLDRQDLPLDAASQELLTSMITVSDNDAATQAFDRVGPEGIDAVGHRAGMSDLETSYIWGATRISAADAAHFFADLDRVIPGRFESFGKGLLGSISPDQSWGIPAVAEPLGWQVRFKGGWRPDPTGQIVNQAAELRRGERTISIAVLSDEGPSFAYGVETVEGVTARLLDDRR